MSVRSASCSVCKTPVPVGPRFNPFKMPPYIIECRNCKNKLKTSFNHRATWMSWVIWEVGWIALTIFFAVLVIMKHYSLLETILITAFGSVIIGIGGAYILSLIIAVPIQAIIDLTRFILVKINMVKSKDKEVSVIDENLRRIPPPD